MCGLQDLHAGWMSTVMQQLFACPQIIKDDIVIICDAREYYLKSCKHNILVVDDCLGRNSNERERETHRFSTKSHERERDWDMHA